MKIPNSWVPESPEVHNCGRHGPGPKQDNDPGEPLGRARLRRNTGHGARDLDVIQGSSPGASGSGRGKLLFQIARDLLGHKLMYPPPQAGDLLHQS